MVVVRGWHMMQSSKLRHAKRRRQCLTIATLPSLPPRRSRMGNFDEAFACVTQLREKAAGELPGVLL